LPAGRHSSPKTGLFVEVSVRVKAGSLIVFSQVGTRIRLIRAAEGNYAIGFCSVRYLDK
jgi:hypothetical protein